MKTIACLLISICAVTPAFAADFPEIAGWSPAGELSTFSSSTLWEHINGAAETFLQYGFQELKTAELSRDGVTVAVGIYDMGAPLNAYGIYRTELPDGAATTAIGAQAVISPPYQCLMTKDRFYVKVDVYEGELDEAAGRAVLETIAGALPGANGMPEAFGKLPSQGKVAGSERFTREAFLGLKELAHCISAEYEAGVKVFVVLPAAGTGDDATWKSLAAKWTSVAHDSGPVLTKKVPYTGVVGVIRTAKGIFGVVGADGEEALLQRLAKL